jgi:hypothetical protein
MERNQPDPAADGDVEDLGAGLPEEFRSPPPLAYDSPEKAAELAEIKNFQRTLKSNASAYF